MEPVWRIAIDAATYAADDMTGKGAELTGGRWNPKGTPLVYASSSISLAVLETLVHLDTTDALPLNRYLVSIAIPKRVFEAATTETTPPVGWDAEPASQTSVNVGRSWIAGGKSALLRVPSVIVPEEFNLLINPSHPDSKGIKAKKVRKFVYDARF
jgi:RES domain-containing protein